MKDLGVQVGLYAAVCSEEVEVNDNGKEGACRILLLYHHPAEI
jgi:hypothetical protein